MKKSIFILAVALAIVFILTGCTGRFVDEPGVQILTFSNTTGDFYYAGSQALQTEWDLAAGNNIGVSSVFSTGSDGLTIDTESAGYASATQAVWLKANSEYKVSYSYDIESVGAFGEDTDDFNGMYIGFVEDPQFNIGSTDNHVHVTRGDGNIEFYFETPGTGGQYHIGIFVGTENLPVNMEVTVNDLTLEYVGRAGTVSAEDKEDYGFYSLHNAVYGMAGENNIVYVVLGAVAVLVLAYIAYVLRSRSMAFEGVSTQNKFFEKLRSTKWMGLLIAVGSAGIVRLLITLIESAIMGSNNILSTHFGYDLTRNAYMGTQVATYGTTYLYSHYYTAYQTMLPLQMYLNTFAGLIGRALGAMGLAEAAIQLAVVTVIKLIAVVADLATVALIYRILEKRFDRVAATIMSAFYGLIPTVFALSAAWGSYESVAAMFVVLAFYFLLNKNSYVGMAISYFAAAMTTVSALFVVPAVLFYTGYRIYKGVREKSAKDIIVPIAMMVGGLIVFYLISLPFVFNEVQAGDAFSAFNRYVDTVEGSSVYTANAFNFQGLLGNNFEAVGTQSIFVTVLYIIFVVVLLAIAYYRTRNRINLTLIAASCVIALWVFGNSMTPEGLFLALPLLFIATAMLKDKRLYAAFIAYAVLAYVNIAYVYLITGYDATGMIAISYETTAIMYVFGAFHLAAIIYYIVIAYDVLINNRAFEQRSMNLSYPEHLRYSFIKVKNALGNFGGKARSFVTATGEALKEVNAENKAKRLAKKQAKEQGSEFGDESSGGNEENADEEDK